MPVDKTDGAAMLKVLMNVTTRSSVGRTVALHERFARPTPCAKKEGLSLALQGWCGDLEELQVAGSSPSRET
eukprot:1762028-Alexandrium_andersonii.AAC.1